MDTLKGLLETAEGQLDAATEAEILAKNNNGLLKQSLLCDPGHLQGASKHLVNLTLFA